MTYQPNIPTGRVRLDIDYASIQGNFQQLDTSFGVDHLPFSDNTAQNGYHTSIHFDPVSTTATNPPNNQPVVAPVTVAGYGQLFSAQIDDGLNPDEALYFLTGGNRLIQLTRNIAPVAATNGYSFLPGGILIQWGTSTSASGTTITYPIAFPNNVFNVQTSISQNTVNRHFVYSRNVTTTNFVSVQLDSAGGAENSTFTWIALGN